MARNSHATFGTVWTFRTKRFMVSLELERDRSYRYDGDDEGGETQAALDSGEYVAFDCRVSVELDGVEIGADSLCGSVYAADEVAAFYTDHRSIDPMNRNCSIMRAKLGDNACICHYFPGMVRAAIGEARLHLSSLKPLPYIREAAHA